MNEKVKLISVGDLFRQSWGLYRERVWILAGIALSGLVVTIAVILGALFTVESIPVELALGDEASTIASFIAVFVFAVIPLLVFWLVSGLAMIYAIPKGVGIGSAYGLAFRNLISFGWLNLLQLLVVLGGILMLIIPGIIFAVWFTLANYIFAIDKERGVNALLKSRDYVRGYWWQIVGRLIVVLLAYLAVGLVVNFLASLIGETVGSIVSAIFEILAAAFWLLVLYVLYQNLKMLKPEVASQSASGPRGLFYFSAVLGVVGLIVLGILFFKFIVPSFLSGGFEPETLPTDYGSSELYQSEAYQLDLPQ